MGARELGHTDVAGRGVAPTAHPELCERQGSTSQLSLHKILPLRRLRKEEGQCPPCHLCAAGVEPRRGAHQTCPQVQLCNCDQI